MHSLRLAEKDAEKTEMTEPMKSAPVAEQRPHTYERHGYTISDPYHWLKDQSYPKIDDEDVLDYLKEENRWFEQNMAAAERSDRRAVRGDESADQGR